MKVELANELPFVRRDFGREATVLDKLVEEKLPRLVISSRFPAQSEPEGFQADLTGEGVEGRAFKQAPFWRKF